MHNYTRTELAKIIDNGISNLMYIFAFDQKTKITDTLRALEKFSLTDLSALFKQIDDEGNNVIMLAMWGSFEAADKLLNVFQKLPDNDKLAILTQANVDGETAFMIAARKNSRLTPKFFTIIESLPEPATIVKQVDITPSDPIISIGNALMWAITFCDAKEVDPVAVLSPFSRILNKLEPNDQAAVLQQINQEGENAVILAAKYNQEYLSGILELTEKINNPTVTAHTLKQVDGLNFSEKAIGFTRRNALQHAMISQSKQPRTPNPVLNILESIFKLPSTFQNEIRGKLSNEESLSLINTVKNCNELDQLIRSNRISKDGGGNAGALKILEIDPAVTIRKNRNRLFYSSLENASAKSSRAITPTIFSSEDATPITPLTA